VMFRDLWLDMRCALTKRRGCFAKSFFSSEC
jgi:hypothetical protein